MTWQLQQAQSQFDELLDATLKEGPQVLTRDGEELAVLVPIDQWKRLERKQLPLETHAEAHRRPALKDLLLAPAPIVEDMMIPARGHLRHRKSLKF